MQTMLLMYMPSSWISWWIWPVCRSGGVMFQHQAVFLRSWRVLVFLLVSQVMKVASWCLRVLVGRLMVLLAPQLVQR